MIEHLYDREKDLESFGWRQVLADWLRSIHSALSTCYLRIPLSNSSTYGKLLSRISSNIVPTCVVSRLRSKHSKTARR